MAEKLGEGNSKMESKLIKVIVSENCNLMAGILSNVASTNVTSKVEYLLNISTNLW